MTSTTEPRPRTDVPAEIDRWNWGAFLLTWIWGIGNNTFIAFLAFVPGVNLVMPFVLGAKGSGWAWRNKRWDGVEHFKKTQRSWAIWGFVVVGGGVLLLIAISVSTAMLAQPKFRKAQLSMAATQARVIRQAAQQWQATNGSPTCPSLSELVGEKFLDPEQTGKDPWGKPYSLVCRDDEVFVTSGGPDKQMNTADDIIASER